MITNDERCTCEIKSWIVTPKAAFNKKKTLHQQTVLKFEEETSEMLCSEHSFVWCRNVDTSGSRSEIPGKFFKVVLQKDCEDQLQ
jgi:hypothetical protein